MWLESVLGVSALFLMGCWIREKQRFATTRIQLMLSEQQCQKLFSLEENLKEKENQCHRLQIENALLCEKMVTLEKAEQHFKNAFSVLSAEALEKNNRSFIELAKLSLEKFQEGARGDLDKRQGAIAELVGPMKEALTKLDQGLQKMENERKGDERSLKEQVHALMENERLLKQETANLVKALRTPLTRGRWGEIQLRRVVELAGMLNQCDFFEQAQQMSDEGRLRPDLIVRLPGGRQVVIDAKVPLQGYLEAIHTQDDSLRSVHLADHARQVRAHISILSKRAYWESFQPTPEFVILFLPAETFFSAALEADPSLIEAGAEQNVIIATPTTLIALLRAVAYGWKQEQLNQEVETLHALGQDLYKRLGDMTSHFSKMGRGLASAVDGYNKAMGSLETRVLVSARKFKELGVSSSQIELSAPESVDALARQGTVE